MRSDYLSGSSEDLWGRTADKTKRPCGGSSVVFWQVPGVNSRYRTQQMECFWMLDILCCVSDSCKSTHLLSTDTFWWCHLVNFEDVVWFIPLSSWLFSMSGLVLLALLCQEWFLNISFAPHNDDSVLCCSGFLWCLNFLFWFAWFLHLGVTISRVLHTLEVLDRHCFDRTDSSNSMETLYHKIFWANQNKDNQEVVISVLCFTFY